MRVEIFFDKENKLLKVEEPDGTMTSLDVTMLREAKELFSRYKEAHFHENDNENEFHEFIEDINDNYTKNEKISLIDFMWRTAYFSLLLPLISIASSFLCSTTYKSFTRYCSISHFVSIIIIISVSRGPLS